MKTKIIQAIPDWMFVALKGWGWKGAFDSWEAAQLRSNGYNADNILQKVLAASLRVKEGDALFERDSVLFYEKEYCWELLAALTWIAAQHDGSLNIIDFGGSLGSTYYQNRSFLDSLKCLQWNIVEQPSFVQKGQQSFENESLRFYRSIDECLRSSQKELQAILLSAVLQYLKRPYSLLMEIIERKIRYIIVDRTGFTLHNRKDRLTVQMVHSRIYRGSYPCWFFNEMKFLRFFSESGYVLRGDFLTSDVANIPSVFKGFIFELRSDA